MFKQILILKMYKLVEYKLKTSKMINFITTQVKKA